MKKQPSKANYFFEGAYVDLGKAYSNYFHNVGYHLTKVIGKDIVSNINHIAGDFRILGSDAFEGFSLIADLFSLVGNSIRFVLSAILSMFLVVLFAPLHFFIVILVMLPIYLVYITVLGIDKLYCLINGIGTTCPSNGCQRHIMLPTYVCSCGAKHTSLIPSKYGVFHRVCKCGKKLPTTFLNGRGKIKTGHWECPHCGYSFGDRSVQSIDITIPVIGGPSSGKTCYITQAIRYLEKNAPKYGLGFGYIENKNLGDDYRDNKARFEKGQLPYKTNDLNLRYYQFYLSNIDAKNKNIISICDVAGEAFDATNDNIGQQIGLGNAKAFLFTLDPLSVKAFRDELKVSYSEYSPSTNLPLDDVLLTLIRNLENLHAIPSSERVNADVAVVFTKCDFPTLDKIFGPDAVYSYQTKNKLYDTYVTYNRMCEEFLIKYGESNFLNALKSKFKSIQFFTCSALGHVENGTTFTPSGVEEPLLWLIDKESVSINLKELWGKKI